MTAIRDELNRLLSIHFGELWVPTGEALEEVEHFGDDLIPGLIDCLGDADDDIRRLAVTLLGETRPRSNAAVPALIELLNDEDLLVKVAVLTHIADFGSVKNSTAWRSTKKRCSMCGSGFETIWWP